MTKPNIPMMLSLDKNRHGRLENQELIFRRPYLRLETAEKKKVETRFEVGANKW